MTNTQARAVVFTAAGINCDLELGRAFELAGAEVQFVHLNRLIADPGLLERYHLIGIPGGFSYGDAIAAGRIMAQLMRQHLYQPLVDAVQRGVPIFAPCNGFQIVAQMGLLPGPVAGQPWPDQPPSPTIALGRNASAQFVDRWTAVEFEPSSRCIWTAGLQVDDDTALLPSAHGEGRFIAADSQVCQQLDSGGQVAVRYHPDQNFNGSTDRIAGICDNSGLIFGLMPHPERYTRWTHHPYWTRLNPQQMQHDPPGLQMFRNAVEHAVAAVGSVTGAVSAG